MFGWIWCLCDDGLYLFRDRESNGTAVNTQSRIQKTINVSRSEILTVNITSAGTCGQTLNRVNMMSHVNTESFNTTWHYPKIYKYKRTHFIFKEKFCQHHLFTLPPPLQWNTNKDSWCLLESSRFALIRTTNKDLHAHWISVKQTQSSELLFQG